MLTNPGYATWQGPYIQDLFAAGGSNTRFKLDAWGVEYSSPAGCSFSSSGGPDVITRTIASSIDDLLYNSVICNLVDLGQSPPGATWRDSVKAVLTYPNGSGSTATKTRYPDANGLIEFDSIPIGLHPLRVIIISENDTLIRKVAVNTGRTANLNIQYFAEIW